MKILVYTRPRIDVFFHELVKYIEVFDEIKFMSDHKGLEEISIMHFFYDAKIEVSSKTINPATEAFQDIIIKRCRYLRWLPKEEAILCVKSMWVAIERIYEIHQPNYIFGMVMDSYVMDIMDRVMRMRGGQYIGFLNNMVNGYSRLTSRGELIHNEEPTVEEVKKAVSALNNKYYVPFMQNDFMWNIKPINMFFTKYLKEKIKIAYYWSLKIIKSDPNSFYYNTVASENCMTCQNLSYIFVEKWGDQNWKDKISNAKNAGKKILYLPLQFYPECSIDYWGTNSQLINFYETVNAIIGAQLENIMIVVKEHPSAMGLRKPDFYNKFEECDNIVLVPCDANSNEIITESDCVLTWTGSVGVEAVVRKKPLITFGRAYYAYEDYFYQIESIEEIQDLDNIVCEHISVHASFQEEALDKIVTNLLSGLVRGYVFPLDYLNKKNPRNNIEMEHLGNNISDAITSLNGECYPLTPGVLK